MAQGIDSILLEVARVCMNYGIVHRLEGVKVRRKRAAEVWMRDHSDGSPLGGDYLKPFSSATRRKTSLSKSQAKKRCIVQHAPSRTKDCSRHLTPPCR
eukprot:3480548-Amphidinium_carterae.1